MPLYRYLLLLLLITSPPGQAEYAVGYFYLKNDQPEKAYREIRKLADVGFAYYMNMVAEMHLQGIGVPADPVLAHVWYSLSAAQDNAEGIRMQGVLNESLDPGQRRESRQLTLEYAQRYLEPYVADWSLDFTAGHSGQ